MTELKREIADLLAKMCNLSLQGVTESGAWNIAIVSPTHTQGSREVDWACLSSLVKMEEPILKYEISEHIDKHRL